MERQLKSKLKIRTAIFSCSILFISIFLLIFHNHNSGSLVVVNKDGVKTYYSLSVDQTIDLDSNTLVIEDGCAYMKYANCKDHICIKQGKIKLNGQTITCLPNKITVSITNNNDDLDVIQ